MLNNIPRPEYYHTKNKAKCKVCRRTLIEPVDSRKKSTLSLIYNRGICSIDCLLDDYDSVDVLTDRLYEYIDDTLSKIQDLRSQND